MLRQAVRLTPSASPFPYLFTKKSKEAPPETLTEKWLKGLFDDQPKRKKEDSKSNRKDDDDQEGGQMMPIPSGVPGLFYSREVRF